MFKFSKKGFSLAELMVVLLLVSLLVTALIPVVTKKHLNLPKRSEHGSYLCYYENGKLYEMKSANRYDGKPGVPKEVSNCVFNPPAKALYFQISAVGGGGGGGDAGYRGGNFHSSWSDIQQLSPWGLTLQELKDLHIVYNGKSYFRKPLADDNNNKLATGEAFTVVKDLSGTLEVYAKGKDSAEGGNAGYVKCFPLSIPDSAIKYEKKSFDYPPCPDLCDPDDCEDTPKSKEYDFTYYNPPGTVTEPTKYCCKYAKGKEVTNCPETKPCLKYKTKTINEYYCKDGSRRYNISTTPKSADACGRNGVGSTPKIVNTNDCEKWGEPKCTTSTQSGECLEYCDGTHTYTTDSPTEVPQKFTAMVCSCKAGTTYKSSECVRMRNEAMGSNTWPRYTSCTPGDAYKIDYNDGYYNYSGGRKGLGYPCTIEVTYPYSNWLMAEQNKNWVQYGRNNISIDQYATSLTNGATDGTSKKPSWTAGYPTSQISGTDGTITCADGQNLNDCRVGSSWSNVPYALIGIKNYQGMLSSVKSYSAPKAGEGAKTQEIYMSEDDVYSSGYTWYEGRGWNPHSGERIQLRKSTDTDGICSGDTPFAICPQGRKYWDDIERGEDGVNGKCQQILNGVTTDISNAGFNTCSIPDEISVAYCLQHHSSYIKGYDKDNNEVRVPLREPGGFAGKEPTYLYRYSVNDNYLMHGNAGEPGEIKTVVVRSLKDMDTTIKIGRGGAGGVKDSGADGMPGSATSMGNIIKAAGGAGGKGSIIDETEQMPGYIVTEYNKQKACWQKHHEEPIDTNIGEDCANYEANGYTYFKTTGNSEGQRSVLKEWATNLYKYILPEDNTSDSYTKKFNEQGKGGVGGGSTHRCWAGQFIVWFEGEILEKTSIFSSGRYKDIKGEWHATPTGGDILTTPVRGKCYDSSGAQPDYITIPAGTGVDGAIMIKW